MKHLCLRMNEIFIVRLENFVFSQCPMILSFFFFLQGELELECLTAVILRHALIEICSCCKASMVKDFSLNSIWRNGLLGGGGGY